jgi:hypothetical protein
MLMVVDLLCKEINVNAVVLGGGAGGCLSGGLGKVVFFACFCFCCCNSYVNRSIMLGMYVDYTKFDLTP